MLKILVDQGFELVEPYPSTIFCLLEFDGVRLATSHSFVEKGRVKFNEEAEFQIKKSGNLKIQLCSIEGNQGFLSINEHKLYGRAKYPVEFTDQKSSSIVEALILKSKSGKERAKIKFRISIPANPAYDPTAKSNLKKTKSGSTQSLKSSSSNKSPKLGSMFKRSASPQRNSGSFRSTQSSQDYGSRQSLDSAGFETHQNNNREVFSDDMMEISNNPFERNTATGNPFESDQTFSIQHDEIAEVKRRDKKSPKQPKSVRRTIIGGFGLGSHKEEGKDNKEDELSKINHENEWLNRQNILLQESLKKKDTEIKELNSYIESLLVKIMSNAPEVLQS